MRNHGQTVYTPEEWWTFDLAMDYIVALGATDGLQRDLKSELDKQPERFHDWLLDKRWARAVKKELRRAGNNGPIALRDLRTTIPPRPNH